MVLNLPYFANPQQSEPRKDPNPKPFEKLDPDLVPHKMNTDQQLQF
jgi:hypothetical protein